MQVATTQKLKIRFVTLRPAPVVETIFVGHTSLIAVLMVDESAREEGRGLEEASNVRERKRHKLRLSTMIIPRVFLQS